MPEVIQLLEGAPYGISHLTVSRPKERVHSLYRCIWNWVVGRIDTGVPRQEEKGRVKHHPICYVSGQFRGSQLNWAALTKEAYAIYMSIRRLAFYVSDTDVTIRCDHLPLKKFLTKQTLNSKVNNWAVELEQFNLKLEWIMGSKNTLADTLSRLLDVCPEVKMEPEPAGQEFGCYCFEDMNVDTEQVSLMVLNIIHGFWASWSSLGITNGNRSHNKPLELI